MNSHDFISGSRAPVAPVDSASENMEIYHATLTGGQAVVVKECRDCPEDFFPAEAHGLALLRQESGLRVPAVHDVRPHCLVLEDLGTGQRANDFWHRAAIGLARQHRTPHPRFGLDHPGYCGDSAQDNSPDENGWHFFAARRLLPQARQARDNGRLDDHDCRRIERLCQQLDQLIPPMPPVLLHGDLWTANLHVCADGRPALIDAGAAHYGWAEAELAMLTLFGSPPGYFFDVYAEHLLLRRDWRDRIPVYNLYHLLNHLNLFGGTYLPAVRAALSSTGQQDA